LLKKRHKHNKQDKAFLLVELFDLLPLQTRVCAAVEMMMRTILVKTLEFCRIPWRTYITHRFLVPILRMSYLIHLQYRQILAVTFFLLPLRNMFYWHANCIHDMHISWNLVHWGYQLNTTI
jgi:hypothetical protein